MTWQWRYAACQVPERDGAPAWQDELYRVLSAVEALYRTTTAMSELDLARLREVGRDWARAHRPLAPLLLAVEDLTAATVTAVIAAGRDDVDVPRLVERLRGAGAVVIRELLTGVRHSGSLAAPHPQLTAANLLWGADVPAAPGYAVIAVHSDGPDAGGSGWHVDDALRACDRPGAVHLLRGGSGYLLAPACDEKDAVELGRRLRGQLSGAVWLAVAWRPNTEIEEGRHEASVVLDLVMRLSWPPCGYAAEDVVVEYALMQDTPAVLTLLSLIAPVVRQQSLRTTLDALIATGGNRTRAAEALEIHRSTLDYRLGRVEQLTGHSPLTARGLQLLAAALTVHQVVHAPTRTARTPP